MHVGRIRGLHTVQRGVPRAALVTLRRLRTFVPTGARPLARASRRCPATMSFCLACVLLPAVHAQAPVKACTLSCEDAKATGQFSTALGFNT
eukprot:COSAG06_NODE_38108_length_427_cov_0.820122_1_plen_91_part_01